MNAAGRGGLLHTAVVRVASVVVHRRSGMEPTGRGELPVQSRRAWSALAPGLTNHGSCLWVWGRCTWQFNHLHYSFAM